MLQVVVSDQKGAKQRTSEQGLGSRVILYNDCYNALFLPLLYRMRFVLKALNYVLQYALKKPYGVLYKK